MGSTIAVATTGARLNGLLPFGDKRLVRLAAAGDDRAFTAIYERYHQEIYRYCRVILGNHDEAQDALQNTMAAALRSLPGEEREIALRPWLHRVAHNEAISIVRRRAPLAGPGLEPVGEEIPTDVRAEDRERLRDLVVDLRSLSERLRAALVMRELSDLSYDDIAGALGLSPGAARQAVYEARLALHELRDGRGMPCADARLIISDRDGRSMRGRRIRAHLRVCDGCADFHAGITSRRDDLQVLAPPLALAAGSGVLASLTGGSTGGALTAGGGTAGVAGAGVSAKALATVAAAVVAGGGGGAIVSATAPGESPTPSPATAQPAAPGDADSRAGAVAPSADSARTSQGGAAGEAGPAGGAATGTTGPEGEPDGAQVAGETDAASVTAVSDAAGQSGSPVALPDARGIADGVTQSAGSAGLQVPSLPSAATVDLPAVDVRGATKGGGALGIDKLVP